MNYWICLILFLLTFIWLKPWRKKINSEKWIILLFIDSLSFSGFLNLNFYKIFSLARFPYHLSDSNRFERYFCFFFLASTFLSGCLFLSLSPTEEIWGTNESFADSNLFRMTRNLLSVFSNLLLGYELHNSIKRDGWDSFFKYTKIVAGILALGVLIEVIFKIDLYHIITGGKPLLYSINYDRARGFAFEPRGASLVVVVVFFAGLIFENRIAFFLNSLLSFVTFYFSRSLSAAAIALFIGSILFIVLAIKKDFERLARLTLTAVVIFVLFSVGGVDKLKDHIKDRLVFQAKAETQISSAHVDERLFLKLISKFENHEATYLNFLFNEPIYILTGAGGGLAGVASRPYQLKRDRYIDPQGSKSLPLVGIVYLFSQLGLVAIFIMGMCLSVLKTWDSRGRIMFNLMLIISFVQLSYFFPIIFCACFYYLSDENFFNRLLNIKRKKAERIILAPKA